MISAKESRQDAGTSKAAKREKLSERLFSFSMVSQPPRFGKIKGSIYADKKRLISVDALREWIKLQTEGTA